jgi:hypothetical protein
LGVFPVDAVVVATMSSCALELARTALEVSLPFGGPSVTVASVEPSTARLLTMIRAITDVVVVRA